jgi:hypothetical protein
MNGPTGVQDEGCDWDETVLSFGGAVGTAALRSSNYAQSDSL